MLLFFLSTTLPKRWRAQNQKRDNASECESSRVGQLLQELTFHLHSDASGRRLVETKRCAVSRFSRFGEVRKGPAKPKAFSRPAPQCRSKLQASGEASTASLADTGDAQAMRMLPSLDPKRDPKKEAKGGLNWKWGSCSKNRWCQSLRIPFESQSCGRSSACAQQARCSMRFKLSHLIGRLKSFATLTGLLRVNSWIAGPGAETKSHKLQGISPSPR